MSLIKSYTKFFIRHSLSNKGNVLISAISLIIGITSTLLILFYVQHQLAFDAWHSKKDKIYRVVMEVTTDGESTNYATTGKPLGPTLLKDYGSVADYASFRSIGGKVAFREGNAFFNENQVYAVNKEVFKVFDFPFVEGNQALALTEPFSVVINQDIAQKYFGREPAEGRELEINGQLYRVSGVMQNLPSNAHLQINALVSEEKAPADFSLQDWFDLENYTYIVLKDANGAEALLPKLKAFAAHHLAPVMEGGHMTIAFQLQQLKEVHFSSGLTMDQPSGNKHYIYIFTVVGFLILLIACFNYVNLTMAQSLNRGKEMGVRRVIGGNSRNLVQQLAYESFCMTIISFLAAIGLVIFVFPAYKEISGLEVSLAAMLNWKFIVVAAVVFFVVALIGGIYPVLYLSKLEPVEALKNKSSYKGNAWLQKSLLTIQFSASLIMLICTLVLVEQMDFLHERDLGFNRERLLVVDLPEDVAYHQDIVRVKEILERNTFVEGASLSGYGSLPGHENGKDVVVLKGPGKPVEKVLNVFSWDDQVVELLDIEIVSGRNFGAEFPSDKTSAVLVNEQLVRELNWKDPLAETIVYGDGGQERQVIGVVKNFHYASLHNRIEPAVIVYQGKYLQKLLLKVQEKNIPLVETTWKQHISGYPFEFTYLDDLWEGQYAGDNRLMQLFKIFSALAMLLACLGLLGLATFTVKQRIKEIGIRRVLGARSKDIFIAISRGFNIVIVLSILIALPLSYYLAAGLLNEFPYRVSISPGTYFIAAFSIMSIVTATIFYSVLKALASRPIHYLKNE